MDVDRWLPDGPRPPAELAGREAPEPARISGPPSVRTGEGRFIDERRLGAAGRPDVERARQSVEGVAPGD